MKTSFADVLEKLNLPFTESARLVALARSDTFDKLVEQSEKDELQSRANLVARLEKLNAERHADERPYKATLKAREDHERAVELVKTTGAALMAAHSALYTFGYAFEREISDIESVLKSGSDRRLQQLLFALDELRNPVRISLTSLPNYEVTFYGKKKFILSNIDSITTAMEAISECESRCRSMQLKAVARKDVTTALQEMCHQLGAVLRPMGINSPRIVDGEISPLFGGG